MERRFLGRSNAILTHSSRRTEGSEANTGNPSDITISMPLPLALPLALRSAPDRQPGRGGGSPITWGGLAQMSGGTSSAKGFLLLLGVGLPPNGKGAGNQTQKQAPPRLIPCRPANPARARLGRATVMRPHVECRPVKETPEAGNRPQTRISGNSIQPWGGGASRISNPQFFVACEGASSNPTTIKISEPDILLKIFGWISLDFLEIDLQTCRPPSHL